MKRGISTAGLVAFLLVDLVLVYLALRPPAVGTAPATPRGVVTSAPVATVGAPAPGPDGTLSPTTPRTAPTGSTVGQRSPRPVRVLLAALDLEVAWRATVGTCAAGGARLAISVDGGATWDDVEAPSATISRIQPLDRDEGFVVGGVEGCGQDQFTTRDGGRAWAGPTALVGAWARRLDRPTEVTTPQSPTAEPCEGDIVIDLSRTSAQQAEALCSDGGVRVTGDGGVSWRDSGQASGALALSNRLEGGVLATYVARVGVEGCDGVQVAKVTQGADPVEVACIRSVRATGGDVAISVADEAGWLVVDDRTWVSGAGLTVWEEA
ncbi:hypothetical protein [Intrasporangium calvum]|uniref:Photosynthesis system II assembly factor Ycf48/Hcf136-like domain-containing protein n=1 Tax=Intrasporangium calvum (strain ATCC 23552 / DSM 43043 / JCM 3097 / NBRC 12989 / NCIMB 10167 / NRRL B-3866 / 7 KIP) TaxID=710696 RepID=E6SEU9_INTC7|nr:hypothetical protein [Intrasporangium calvum]ADU47706.1 hypothetical protein Intca_1188 [Intrasporangium calvum DSM 43043]